MLPLFIFLFLFIVAARDKLVGVQRNDWYGYSIIHFLAMSTMQVFQFPDQDIRMASGSSEYQIDPLKEERRKPHK